MCLILLCFQRSDLVGKRVVYVSRSSLWQVECVPIILRQCDSFLQAQGEIRLWGCTLEPSPPPRRKSTHISNEMTAKGDQTAMLLHCAVGGATIEATSRNLRSIAPPLPPPLLKVAITFLSKLPLYFTT